jgi:hypothetical protein
MPQAAWIMSKLSVTFIQKPVSTQRSCTSCRVWKRHFHKYRWLKLIPTLQNLFYSFYYSHRWGSGYASPAGDILRTPYPIYYINKIGNKTSGNHYNAQQPYRLRNIHSLLRSLTHLNFHTLNPQTVDHLP